MIHKMSQPFWFYCISLFILILARYILVAGGTHLFFYSDAGNFFSRKSLAIASPDWKTVSKDIELSVKSAIVFSVSSALVLCAYDSGSTLLYSDIHQHGLAYLAISYVSVLILQDAYFYFTHRLFHHPLFFKWLHEGHHRSKETTPWTSFAFDPLEAVFQALFLIVIAYLIPIHFITLIAILITMTVWAVVNHLKLDLFPPNFPHHWLGKWFIGPAHHSIHHHRFSKHYGLYLTIWDKLLSTNDKNYDIDMNEIRRL